MPRTLVAAAIQLAAHSRASFESAWPGIPPRIEAAAAAGAQLVVLPEATLPAYVLGHRPYVEEETQAAIEQCRSLARRLGIVLVAGAARAQGERVYNSALVIDSDGSIAGAADKHFLWHFDHQWFAQGSAIRPVATSIGSLGALVCADGRIPTIARSLVDQGAELLVMPTAWVTSGRDPEHLENAQADLLARVRAKENGVPFIAANKCGVELDCVAYCGKSQIVAHDGCILARAPQDREETLLARVEIGNSTPLRSATLAVLPAAVPEHSIRVAVAARGPQTGDEETLRILEADTLLYGDGSPALGSGANCIIAGDAEMLDPGGLVDARLRGYTLALWNTHFDPQWQVTFARARALELRMYVIVTDTLTRRAYAVDPDGSIVCGTFGRYEIASFAFDLARTRQTALAPGTDVLAGLQRAQSYVS